MITLDFERRPSALGYMAAAAWPGARKRGLPELRARWLGHRVDRNELRAFLAITGEPLRDELPILYPHTFGFRLPMVVLTHPKFPVPIWGVLQTRNHILQHRPIPIDAVLDFETRVVIRREVEKGTEFDLHTTVQVGGTLAWESLLTFHARGRPRNPRAPSPLAASPLPPAPFVREWVMADDAHWRFGAFTGDYNGIHAWDWYARRFGFPRALYHPPRVLGQCLGHWGADLQAPMRLDLWLKGPVHHGDRVRLHADDATFALFAGDSTRPSYVGRREQVPSGARLF